MNPFASRRNRWPILVIFGFALTLLFANVYFRPSSASMVDPQTGPDPEWRDDSIRVDLAPGQRQIGASLVPARALETPLVPQTYRQSGFRPLSVPTPMSAPGDELKADRMRGEIVIVYSAKARAVDRKAVRMEENLDVSREIPQLRVEVVKSKEALMPVKLRALRQSPYVVSAEPNYLATAQETLPNDPELGRQWGLRVIDAATGWDLETGASDVVIAVVDTGVDFRHPDLSDKLVAGWDFVNGDDTPQDDNGHGTHVAGIAAASTNNGVGVAGMAWGARIMPIKVLDASGSGTYADVAAGIVYAADHGAQVINLSLGGIAPSMALEEAVNYAHDRGAVVVAAAGNRGSAGVIYPARYPNAIAVAAVDPGLNPASFSSYGPEVDIAAPGVGIHSTLLGGGYGEMSGTSMAVPYVAGAAALLESLDRSGLPEQVRTALENAASDLGGQGRDDVFGGGLLRVGAAIAYARATEPTTTPFATASAAVTLTPSPLVTATPTASATAAPPATPWAPPAATPVPSEATTELKRANGVALSYIWQADGVFLYTSRYDGSDRRLAAVEDPARIRLDLVALSPDGRRFAYVFGYDQEGMFDAGIRVIDIASGTIIVQLDPDPPYYNTSPLWSPDGNWLAYARLNLARSSKVKAELWVVGMDTRVPHALVTDETFGPAFFFGKSFAIEWSADNSQIQYYDEIGSKNVYRVNVMNGQVARADASEFTAGIAAYVGRILEAAVNSTSTTVRPLSGLPSYVGKNTSTYNVLYLQKYYDASSYEGSGVHSGVDIAVPASDCGNAAVRSIADGTTWLGQSAWGPSGTNLCGANSGGWGNYVVVRHEMAEAGGYGGTVYSIYAHLHDAINITSCSPVSAGYQIGTVGSTGNSTAPHLHFQVDRDSAQVHPWPQPCSLDDLCSNTSLIPTVVANTWNPMMFTQAYEGGSGVTVYDQTGYNPVLPAKYEVFRYNDPYLEENPIGNDAISSVRVPAGWVLIVYPDPAYGGEPKEITADVANLSTLGMDNRISSLKVAYMACPAGSLADVEVPRMGAESCLPGGNPPTATPTPYVPPGVIDGFRLVSVSSPTVLKGESFGVNVTYAIVSGSLLQSRGDHLHATPEDNSNSFGAWPVQGVTGSHYSGETYTFSFNLTAPEQTGSYESHWRLRIGGNHVGPEAVVRFTVQEQPPAPPGGVYVCTGTGYGGDCYGPLTEDYSSVDPINDQVESVWISGCYSAVLYWDSNFSGEHMHTGGTSDLGDHWRNQVSSIRVRSCDNAAFTIYGLGDYNGEAWASDRTIYDLGHWEKNDWAQSMRVATGKGIVACEHADFHGRCGRATGPAQFSDINALAQGLRNGLSSVRVCEGACPQPPGSPALIYPVSGGHAPSNKDVILQWTGDGWQYYAELWGGGISGTRQFGWSSDSQWNVGQLPQSASPYYWRVRGWNGYGEGGWADGSFQIQPPTVEVMGVYTTDENGASGQVMGAPVMQANAVAISEFKTTFNAGDPIHLHIDANNDFTVDTEAFFEWRVTDPAGRLVGSLSWSGTLATNPGRVGWYMPTTIPSDALTGDYTFTGLVTYNGQTTSRITSFYVTGLSIIQVVGVFTTDELGPAAANHKPTRLDQAPVRETGNKASFNAGDPIGLCIDVYSNLSQDALAGFKWQTTDPLVRDVLELSWNGDLTTPAGRVWWCLTSAIPAETISGDYLFRGSVTYDGRTTWFETAFRISGPPALQVVEVFTTDEDGPSTSGYSSPQSARGGVRSGAYKTSFNAGDPIQLWLGTYSDYPDPQQTEYRWLVIGPLGEEVSALEWSGILTTGVGREWWHLSSTIPADARTGEYLFAGIVTHNGHTTRVETTFQVTGPPTVEVLAVFATDESGVSGSGVRSPLGMQPGIKANTIKSAFSAGDSIRLYIDTYNNVPADVVAEFGWSVADPFGVPVPELSWSGSLTTPAQGVWWFLPTTVPQAAISGEYSYEGRIAYNGGTSNRSTSLCVAGSNPDPYMVSAEVPAGDPPYFVMPYARAAFDFDASPVGNVTVTLHGGPVPALLDGVAALTGYWDVTADFTDFVTDVIFTYSVCDLHGISEASIVGAACWNGERAGWEYSVGVVDTEADTVTLVGVQAFSRCYLIASSPPRAPEELTIAKVGTDALLAWQSVTMDIRGANIAAPAYRVYRSEDGPYFTPTESNRIATVSDTYYFDTDALADTEHNYYYLVRAADAQGQTSAVSRRVGKMVMRLRPGQNP